MKLALCNEVLREHAVRRAVPARRRARLPRAGARAVHAGRRSVHAQRGEARPLRGIAGRPRAGDLEPALAAGASPRGCRSSTTTHALHARTRRLAEAADRLCRRLRRARARARLAEAALAAAGPERAERARARSKPRWAQLAPMRANARASSTASSRWRAPRRRCSTRWREAAALVDRIGSPALRTMLDMSAASQSRSEPPPTLLRPLPCRAATSRTCSSTIATGAGRARASTPVRAACCACCARRGVRRLGRGRALRLPARSAGLRGRPAPAMCAAPAGGAA